MGYWYCPKCDREVSEYFVSYEETHDNDGCGHHPVEWIDDEEDESCQS